MYSAFPQMAHTISCIYMCIFQIIYHTTQLLKYIYFFVSLLDLWRGTGIAVGVLAVCFKQNMIEGKVYKLYTNTTQQGSGMLKRPMKWKCEVLTSNVILIKSSLLKSLLFQELTAIDTSHFILYKCILKFETRE